MTAEATVPGVILAAGRSSRMGSPKALLVIDGRTILDRLIEAFAAARLSPIAVVASGEALAYARALPGIVVVEGDPRRPMIDSLARALATLERASKGALSGLVVQPVDAAFTTPEAIRALVYGSATRSRILVHAGEPAHPVFASPSTFAGIRARREGGLRAVLAEDDPELVPFDDPRILADLDTPDDVARWLAEPPGRDPA